MKKDGFTLIEILVASVISAFIAVTAVSAMKTISLGRSKIEDRSVAAGELRYVSDIIRKDMANLYRSDKPEKVVLVGSLEIGETGMTSVLKAHVVNMVKARVGQPESDVFEVQYFLQQTDEKTLFMRRLQPNPFDQEIAGGILTAIAEKIVGFTVTYLNEVEEWMDEWPEENTNLPNLVKIDLTAETPQSKRVTKYSFLVDFPRWTASGEQREEGTRQ